MCDGGISSCLSSGNQTFSSRMSKNKKFYRIFVDELVLLEGKKQMKDYVINYRSIRIKYTTWTFLVIQ